MRSEFADGLSEEEFRRSIEARLRENRPEEAIARLRRLLAHDCGPGRTLPARFLSVCSADLVLLGWERLAERIRAHDVPGRPVTALSIAFGWPGEDPPRPDANGCLSPLVETGFFDDSAYPFSQSNRDNLLEGYSYYGCTWAGEAKATETILTLGGIDDLHGALAELEARLLASDDPDEDQIRAGSLGACLLSVLLFQAVGERIASQGLPRPLCVTAGSNGVYPYFDAPVAGMPDHVLAAEDAALNRASHFVPGPRYASLLVTGIPRARKRAVLVIDESESETAVRLAALRNLDHHEDPPPAPPAPTDPEPFAEIAALAPGDGQILPNPAGPLLVKRRPAPAGDRPDPPDQDGAPARLPGTFPIDPRPAGAYPALSEPPLDVPVEPGFSLLGQDVKSRLKALVARPGEGPAPASSGTTRAQRSTPAAPDSSPAARPSLWTRLRQWLRGLRADYPL